MNYTKGEWLVSQAQSNEIITNYDVDDTVAAVYNKQKEWQANAHLIASAPDMYEALKKVYRTTYVQTPELHGMIQKALAKAEGK
jgi:hypothetical protein